MCRNVLIDSLSVGGPGGQGRKAIQITLHTPCTRWKMDGPPPRERSRAVTAFQKVERGRGWFPKREKTKSVNNARRRLSLSDIGRAARFAA